MTDSTKGGLELRGGPDNFVLRQTNGKGEITEIAMSASELHGLKTTIDLWSDRIVSQMPVGSGTVQRLVAIFVDQVRLIPDALKENALLSYRGMSGGESTLSIPPKLAAYLASEFPIVLGQLQEPGTAN